MACNVEATAFSLVFVPARGSIPIFVMCGTATTTGGTSDPMCAAAACAGGELFEHISKRANVTEATAATICRSLLQYLAHAHGLGVAHMDIKPENIMFDSHGADGVLKVGRLVREEKGVCGPAATRRWWQEQGHETAQVNMPESGISRVLGFCCLPTACG